MIKRNLSEIFIHMLIEALEADRLIRKTSLAQRYKDGSERFKELVILDLNDSKRSLDPLDCVQQMAQELRAERRRT